MTDSEPKPGIERAHGREIAASQRLLDFARDLLIPWPGRKIDGGADLVVAAEIARSVKTARASLVLSRAGFGQQATMLNRSLFEGMLVAHWVHLNPEAAEERFANHEKYMRLRWRDTFLKYEYEGADAIELIEGADRDELVGTFGEWGDKPWTGLSAYRLVQAVRGEWDDGGATLVEHFDVAQQHANMTLHSSAWSLNGMVTGHDADGVSFELGPSNENVIQAIYMSYWCLLNMLRLLMRRFEIADAEFLELTERDSHAFAHLSKAQRDATGRNDPCPCGSDVKYKKCHGA